MVSTCKYAIAKHDEAAVARAIAKCEKELVKIKDGEEQLQFRK